MKKLIVSLAVSTPLFFGVGSSVASTEHGSVSLDSLSKAVYAHPITYGASAEGTKLAWYRHGWHRWHRWHPWHPWHRWHRWHRY